MKLPRHYPVWFWAIWCEGNCERVWGRNGKGKSIKRNPYGKGRECSWTPREKKSRRGFFSWKDVCQEIGGRRMGTDLRMMISRDHQGAIWLIFPHLLGSVPSSHTLWLDLTGFQNRKKKNKPGKAKMRPPPPSTKSVGVTMMALFD